MLTGQKNHVQTVLKERKNWMQHLEHSDLSYFHSRYPEIFMETIEVVDSSCMEFRKKKVKRVAKPFSGKIPVYLALRKAGKVKKCTWAERELEIQNQKKEKKQNA